MTSKSSVGCTLVLFGLAVALIYPPWLGYAISLVWGWHVAGWHGLPTIGVATATVIVVIVGAIRAKMDVDAIVDREERDDEAKRAIVGICVRALTPALVLLYGWVLT